MTNGRDYLPEDCANVLQEKKAHSTGNEAKVCRATWCRRSVEDTHAMRGSQQDALREPITERLLTGEERRQKGEGAAQRGLLARVLHRRCDQSSAPIVDALESFHSECTARTRRRHWWKVVRVVLCCCLRFDVASAKTDVGLRHTRK